MNCHRCEEQLGDYIDGTLPASAAAQLETHLAGCLRCRAAAEDLEAIRLMAQALEPHTPAPQVWQRIAAATEPRSHSWWTLTTFASWQPAAAAAMLLLMTTGLWWVAGQLAATSPPGAALTVTAPADTDAVAAAPVDMRNGVSEVQYTAAIASLEQVTNAQQQTLDPGTAEVLQTGISVIDRAIAESRAALTSNPENEVAQESLFQALRRKIALLQQMLALINEMRKGNEDGAARIIAELNP